MLQVQFSENSLYNDPSKARCVFGFLVMSILKVNTFPAWKLEEWNRHRERQMYLQQGLEIHGLEEHGPWRYTVFNWFPKRLRCTDFGQKPWRYTVFDFLVKKIMPINFTKYKVFQFLWLDYFVSQVYFGREDLKTHE